MTEQSAAVDARFRAATAAFAAANAEDPNSDEAPDGPKPRELLYGQRMSEWLGRLHPDASEVLRLAARCQHIEQASSLISEPALRRSYLNLHAHGQLIDLHRSLR